MSGRTYVAVTGAAGFIGRNVVAELNRRGVEDIIAVDELGTDERWKNLRGLRFADYLQSGEFREAFNGGVCPDISAVYHLGACSSTTERDADYLVDNNFRYTQELCRFCLEKGARLVYASSAATYGDGGKGYADDEARLEELEPLNMYGMSKQLFDLWAKREGLLGQIVGLKFFNVYGPFEDHKGDMRSVIHKAYGQILETGKVRLFKSYRPEYGDGEQVRDFVYVKDAVDMMLWFGEHRERGGIFNCGTGKARSWNDLAKAVFVAMGREPNIEYIEMPETLRGKYQYFTEAEMGKARAAGYGHEFASLEAGVKDYVETHLRQVLGGGAA